MYSLPHHSDNEVGPSQDPGLPSSLELTKTVCSAEISCPEGLFCDHHFGLCLTLRQEGEFCRQDAHCTQGLSCMFGKCHQTIPGGQEAIPSLRPPPMVKLHPFPLCPFEVPVVNRIRTALLSPAVPASTERWFAREGCV
ncbi:Fatty acid oxidation complex subunit alpha [Varanus komodoensis]|nr:Fatty acid oxidation complex subunit alpha [Varanus komodoensis]